MNAHTRARSPASSLSSVSPSRRPRTLGKRRAVENAIRLRVEQARLQPAVGVRGARLLQPQAVARFFETRAFAPAWRLPAGAQQMLAAIRNIEQDGLTPADYHLAAITAALEAYAKTPSTEVAADLQVLIADAAAALVDHVRYGRVRPASLDKRWNVDPRAGAPPLDVALDELARAPGLDAGIEAQKPTHFIYTGLKQALARMRAVARAGGWPAVPAGPRDQAGRHRPSRRAVGNGSSSPASSRPTTPPSDTVYDDGSPGRGQELSRRIIASPPTASIGKATVEAMNVTAEARVQQVRVNLERARWVVGGPERHVRARQSAGVQGLPDPRRQERLGNAHADRARGAADADVPRRHAVPGVQPGLDRAADDPRAGRARGHAQGAEHDRARSG